MADKSQTSAKHMNNGSENDADQNCDIRSKVNLPSIDKNTERTNGVKINNCISVNQRIRGTMLAKLAPRVCRKATWRRQRNLPLIYRAQRKSPLLAMRKESSLLIIVTTVTDHALVEQYF